LLQQRAQAHKRSISQQALVDLEAIAGDVMRASVAAWRSIASPGAAPWPPP
jgi:hypothetical protein